MRIVMIVISSMMIKMILVITLGSALGFPQQHSPLLGNHQIMMIMMILIMIMMMIVIILIIIMIWIISEVYTHMMKLVKVDSCTTRMIIRDTSISHV